MKDFLRSCRADIGLLQETKLSFVSDSLVKEILGASIRDNWLYKEAMGASGGILVMWNKAVFNKKDQWVGAFPTSVLLEEVSSNSSWIVTSVYSPNDITQCDLLRSELVSMLNKWSDPWWIGSDWNVVRFPSKRSGCNLHTSDMTAFSDWISQHKSVDLQLDGARFTWSNHQHPPSFSCIDRFLVSGDWLDLFPAVCQFALPKPTSDHCPIMLDTKCER